MLTDMGITVVESEEEAEPPRGAGPRRSRSASHRKPADQGRAPQKPPTDRTDDPVRMYLREMGPVELLSREGEIAIAKRIEAGREAMIQGLCESPLTFQAIIIWRDELNEGKILLRDIIDLEATYAGPDAKTTPGRCRRGAAEPQEARADQEAPQRPRERRAARRARAAPRR